MLSLYLGHRAHVLKILEELRRVQHIAKPADTIEQMRSQHGNIPIALEKHLGGKSSEPQEAQAQALHDVAVQLLEEQAFVESTIKTKNVVKRDIAGINAVATKIAKLKGASYKLIESPRKDNIGQDAKEALYKLIVETCEVSELLAKPPKIEPGDHYDAGSLMFAYMRKLLACVEGSEKRGVKAITKGFSLGFPDQASRFSFGPD